MKIALLLIALGLGFKIFTDANKEQASVKSIGRIIGIVMMLVSAFTGTLMAARCAKAIYCPGKDIRCAFMSRVCPMMK